MSRISWTQNPEPEPHSFPMGAALLLQGLLRSLTPSPGQRFLSAHLQRMRREVQTLCSLKRLYAIQWRIKFMPNYWSYLENRKSYLKNSRTVSATRLAASKRCFWILAVTSGLFLRAVYKYFEFLTIREKNHFSPIDLYREEYLTHGLLSPIAQKPWI